MRTSEEFFARVEKREGACWIFRAPLDVHGRASVNWRGVTRRAHQVAFELAHGAPAPDGKVVMHACDVPACCNPAHLRLGTHDENMADMAAKGRAWSPGPAKVECKNGHPYDESNTYRRKDRAGRQCRRCVRAAKDRYRAKAGAAAGAKPFPNRSSSPETETAPVSAGAANLHTDNVL